jgi:hypothetical protein
MTQTVNIQTQPTGTMADSMYQQRDLVEDDEHMREFDDMTETQDHRPQTDGETRSLARSVYESEHARDDSPGQQLLEEELFRLRQRPAGSQLSHKSWEVAQHNEEDDDGNVSFQFTFKILMTMVKETVHPDLCQTYLLKQTTTTKWWFNIKSTNPESTVQMEVR